MWPVRISDVSGPELGTPVSLRDEPALRRWLEEAARQPAKTWDLYVGRDAGLRFVLGLDLAGGILEADADGGGWWLHEGDAAAPVREVPCDGLETEVPGSQQLDPARLVEVIVSYAREVERPPGRWLDAYDRPEKPRSEGWHGSAPRAWGDATRRLLDRIAGTPRRPQPLQSVLGLLHDARDEDLRAYLYAFAHHRAGSVGVGDWWPSEPRLRDRDVQVGTLASGEAVVARRVGGVELLAPDGWVRSSFEDFLVQQEPAE